MNFTKYSNSQPNADMFNCNRNVWNLLLQGSSPVPYLLSRIGDSFAITVQGKNEVFISSFIREGIDNEEKMKSLIEEVGEGVTKFYKEESLKNKLA